VQVHHHILAFPASHSLLSTGAGTIFAPPTAMPNRTTVRLITSRRDAR
jgi:hypothetical protein